MKRFVKRFLLKAAPQWTTALLSARSRAHSHRVVASWGCRSVTYKLIERFGNEVLEGPFAGVTLTKMTHAEQLGPILLGVYESELDEAWNTVFHGKYTQLIDIGAKFGYYAIGLARKYPNSSVVAFDTDWWARKALYEMAVANKTRNLDIRGYCHPRWLTEQCDAAAFVLCDCEGFEGVLFNPDVIARVRSATLLIETHDCFVPGVSDRLRAAFSETHSVQAYGTDDSRRQFSRPLDFLTPSEQRLATHEVRSNGLWLLCLPKTGPNQGLHLTPPQSPRSSDFISVRPLKTMN